MIVYICDSRGVRDILDTDGSSALATSEPLVVLVWFLLLALVASVSYKEFGPNAQLVNMMVLCSCFF